MKSAVALWLTLVVVALAFLPAAWILAREALRRLGTARALRQVAEARRIVGDSPSADAPSLARDLTERFDPLKVAVASHEVFARTPR